MQKITITALCLFLITCTAGCNQSNPVTLENMKKALINAGYIVNEYYYELYRPKEDSINSIGGFSFVFPGAHGNVMTPVLEFKDNASAETHAAIINSNDNFLAITNDTFLTIAHVHDGIPYENEQKFLENLLNGRAIN